MEKYGIENLKIVLAFALDVKKSVMDAREDDGKVKGTAEYLSILSNGLKLPNVISAAPQLKQEFLDLSSEEKNELVEYFAGEFDIKNDVAERWIEKGFSFLLGLADLLGE